MIARYYIGLGSNLGDRLAHLRRAVARLTREGALLGSGVWETRPVGPGSGPFLNAVVRLDVRREPSPEPTSELAPDPGALLDLLLALELEAGRVRTVRWGDRVLDLDLLCGFVDGVAISHASDRLRLPHPRLAERDFVLTPLLELAPDLELAGRSCRAILDAIPSERRTVLRRLDDTLGSASVVPPGG